MISGADTFKNLLHMHTHICIGSLTCNEIRQGVGSITLPDPGWDTGAEVHSDDTEDWEEKKSEVKFSGTKCHCKDKQGSICNPSSYYQLPFRRLSLLWVNTDQPGTVYKPGQPCSEQISTSCSRYEKQFLG